MTRLKPTWLFLFLLVVICMGILLVFFPLGNGVYAFQPNQSNSSTPSPTFTPVPSNPVDLYAFANGPNGEVDSPYILFTAFGDLPDGIPIGIKGTISGRAGFQCKSTPCKLPLTTDVTIDFQAFTTSGSTSQNYSAVARVFISSNGKSTVTVKTSPPQPLYTDSCSSIWGVSISP